MSDSVINYTNAMAQARLLVIQGIISKDEYLKIESRMAQKYSLNTLSLYRTSDLINNQKRVIDMIRK